VRSRNRSSNIFHTGRLNASCYTFKPVCNANRNFKNSSRSIHVYNVIGIRTCVYKVRYSSVAVLDETNWKEAPADNSSVVSFIIIFNYKTRNKVYTVQYAMCWTETIAPYLYIYIYIWYMTYILYYDVAVISRRNLFLENYCAEIYKCPIKMQTRLFQSSKHRRPYP